MNLPLPILVVGDVSPMEFRAAAEWLTERGAMFVAGMNEALAEIENGFAPAIVFVAAQWPEQLAAREVERIRRAVPLARISALLGPWLEGETRTGSPWPVVARTYWNHWPAQMARQWESWTTAEFSEWALPITATDDERLLATTEPREAALTSESFAQRPVIAIHAWQRETWESLSAVCHLFGYSAIWLRRGEQNNPAAQLVLFDVRHISDYELNYLASLKRSITDTPIIALAGFPRFDDVDRLKIAGAAATVSKPFLNEDLKWQIEQLLHSHPATTLCP